ncbi:MAG: hypothetical protein ACJ75J_01780 [Cytophagaceae bacterium]
MNRLFKRTAYAVTGVSAMALLMLNKCSCNREEQTSGNEKNSVPVTEVRFIDPFSDSFNVPFTEYIVQSGRDTVIRHASGTIISIPACAFSGRNGEEIKGAVRIKYREMMTKADIIASGIPMKVKPGQDEFLETAGMMEFRASQNDQELQSSGNCPVKFEMVNTMASDHVNLYYLDPAQQSWIHKKADLPAHIYKGKKKKTAYPEPDYSKMAPAAYAVPVKPRVANPSRFSFHFKIDLSKFPEVNVYDGILWEYAGSGGADDPKKNTWVENARWKEMSLNSTGKKGVYRLRLTSSDKFFETIVKPVFDKEDMEYAMDVFNDRYEKYQRFVEMKKEEHRRWVAEQERIKAEEARIRGVFEKAEMITRTFEINNLGIWNCDRLREIDQPVTIALSFKTSDALKIERVYLIDGTVNSVISYYAADNSIPYFKYGKVNRYKMLLLDSKAGVHVLEPSEFFSRDIKEGRLSIPVSPEGKQIKGLNELNALI